jgi:hypothetical protein
MKKKAGKGFHPPFAGIILIRYAGIFSAFFQKKKHPGK